MRKRLFTVVSDDPRTLVRFLATQDIDAAYIERGNVHVNRRRVTDANTELQNGDRVAVFDTEHQTLRSLVFAYSDPNVMVIDKPAGLSTQQTNTQTAASVEHLLHEQYPNMRLVHRLDRDTSGLILCARKGEALEILAQALAAHQVERRYLAVVGGATAQEGAIDLRIGIDPNDRRQRVALPSQAPQGEPAITLYHRLPCADASVSVLELELKTGRTHQIRVHVAAIGHPIVGDTMYGGRAHARLLLHAIELSFVHPLHKERVVVKSPLPSEFADFYSTPKDDRGES